MILYILFSFFPKKKIVFRKNLASIKLFLYLNLYILILKISGFFVKFNVQCKKWWYTISRFWWYQTNTYHSYTNAGIRTLILLTVLFINNYKYFNIIIIYEFITYFSHFIKYVHVLNNNNVLKLDAKHFFILIFLHFYRKTCSVLSFDLSHRMSQNIGDNILGAKNGLKWIKSLVLFCNIRSYYWNIKYWNLIKQRAPRWYEKRLVPLET